jgi:hypothetical protein
MNIFQLTFGSLQFSRGIRTLNLQVSRLEKEVKRINDRNPVVEAKVRIYEASLELLLNSSESNKFISQKDHKIAELVLAKLRKIHEILQERISWWDKLMSFIEKAISILNRLLDSLISLIKKIPPFASKLREFVLSALAAADSIALAFQDIQFSLPSSQ